MEVTLRQYNGVYSVFVGTKEEKELVKTTRVISEAENAVKEWTAKVKKFNK